MINDKVAAGETEAALAAATPFQSLFGLTAGGIYLAKSALVETGNNDRAALCRYFAENHVNGSGALRARVEFGAASFEAAAASLIA